MAPAGIFNQDLFSMETLAASINQLPYVPGRLGRLGLFEEAGIATLTAIIERQGSTLSLVSNKPRGAPGASVTADKRGAISIIAPHLPVEDAIVADELQGVREFGSASEMRTLTGLRDRKLLKMGRMLDQTLEYHRMGAIQGIVLDADGSTVIFNAFTAFGISAPGDIPITFSTAYSSATMAGPIATAITVAKRTVRDALGGDEADDYYVACSDSFFDKLKNHGEVRGTYLNQQAANAMRENPNTGGTIDSVYYSGMLFENYRGKGSVVVPDGKAVIVPRGIPGLYITRFAPAPWFSAVNTLGLPKYVLATPDPTGEKRLDLEAQTNPINLCTRPEAIRWFVAA